MKYKLGLASALLLCAIVLTSSFTAAQAQDLSYPIVDTGQTACYDEWGRESTCPGQALYGQDAQHQGHTPSYTDNGDGTIMDNITGLIWQRSPDLDGDGIIDAADKRTYSQAQSYCQGLSLAGHGDWRLPEIKQLYSLIDFSGVDPSGYNGSNTSGLVPFIDTTYFEFGYGDTRAGERIIDAQYASSTLYVGTVMGGAQAMFGVNLADGRIKGYPVVSPRGEKTFYVLCVRGNTDYGQNDLGDNGDGTITDRATGLMWAQDDSGAAYNWQEALAWVQQQNAAGYLGYGDWRLPNAKELQSIVDYSRSPDTTASAAIDPLFEASQIANEAGQADYPAYWSSTTHANMSAVPGANAAYVSFGRAMGYMNGTWLDVHGAGAQRSDPKSGDPADWPTGHGPQGDAIRIYNHVRLVRDADTGTETPAMDQRIYAPLIVADHSAAGSSPLSGTSPVESTAGDSLLEDQLNGPGEQQRGPPQEALAACSTSDQGAFCQFTVPHGPLTGTCRLIEQQLACIPLGGPPTGQSLRQPLPERLSMGQR